jgi:hypothetical protein
MLSYVVAISDRRINSYRADLKKSTAGDLTMAETTIWGVALFLLFRSLVRIVRRSETAATLERQQKPAG